MPDSPQPDPPKPEAKLSFFAELKRRKVVRVAITYAIVAWVIIQIASATFSGFGIPDWAFRFVVIMLLLGFPVALIIAWAFELTPEGVKLTKNVEPKTNQGSFQSKRNWMVVGLAAALPTLIFGALAVFFYFNSGPSEDQSRGDTSPQETSIAVLAFENMSGNADNEYFSDGISEELLNVLAKVPDLKVTARTSAFHFKGKDIPIPEIARQLGVAYVVEGSVRRVGDRVRITAQLIKADDGFHMWSDNFDRELRDIFAVQDEIAGLIAEQLKLKIGISEGPRPVNPEAYRLLLEGRHYWNQRGGANFDQAEARLTQALTLDPEFAEVHAALAEVWIMRAAYLNFEGYADVAEEIRVARNHANQALALDSSLARPHDTLAGIAIIEGKWEDAQTSILRALELSPRDASIRKSYAEILEQMGDLSGSNRELRTAQSYDPLSFLISFKRGADFMRRYDWEKALLHFQEANRLRAGGFVPARARESALLFQMGRTEEAVRIAREVRDSWPSGPRLAADLYVIGVLKLAGLKEESHAHAEMILDELPERSHIKGMVLIITDRIDEALPYLEMAPPIVHWWFFNIPELVDDPRFLDIVERWGDTGQYQAFRHSMQEINRTNPAGADEFELFRPKAQR